MRGDDSKQEAMFGYVLPEQRVPMDQPLRSIREMVDTILKEMSPWFARLYSDVVRLSIGLPPGRFSFCSPGGVPRIPCAVETKSRVSSFLSSPPSPLGVRNL